MVRSDESRRDASPCWLRKSTRDASKRRESDPLVTEVTSVECEGGFIRSNPRSLR
jgi:hypothetical protein